MHNSAFGGTVIFSVDVPTFDILPMECFRGNRDPMYLPGPNFAADDQGASTVARGER